MFGICIFSSSTFIGAVFSLTPDVIVVCIIKPFSPFMLYGTNLLTFASTTASELVTQFKLKSISFSILFCTALLSMYIPDIFALFTALN